MPVGGVGGLLGQLINPGLDARLAQHITPNPNPLAQQGQANPPGAVDALGNPVGGQNLAGAAVTQPDPANAANIARLSQPDSSFAADILQRQRMDAYGASLNQAMAGVAASFGTKEQQKAKMDALAGGGGGTVGDAIGSLSGIQTMEEKQMGLNAAARARANAALFGQILGSQGIQGVGNPALAGEAMDVPDLQKGLSEAAGINARRTDAQKNVDDAVRAWAAANPQATPAEIAQHRSDLLEQGVGGLSGVGKQLAEDRRNYMKMHPGATPAQMIADKPELADEASYVAVKGEQAKTTAAAGQARLDAKETLPSLEPQYQDAETKIAWLQAHPEATARAVHWGAAAGGPVGQVAGGFGLLDQETKDARGILDQLGDINFRGAMSHTKNIRSQTEAIKIGNSVTNLDKRSNSDQVIESELKRLGDNARTAYANLLAAAGRQVPARYTGLADRDYFKAGSPLYNGASEEKIDFTGKSNAEADAAYDGLPPGTVYTDTDGKMKRKPW